MDIDIIYVRKGNVFVHRGGLIPVNYTLFYNRANPDPATHLFTSSVFGSAHSGSGAVLKSIILSATDVNPCEKGTDFPRCYKGNLLPVLRDFSLNEIKSLNATSSDFVVPLTILPNRSCGNSSSCY